MLRGHSFLGRCDSWKPGRVKHIGMSFYQVLDVNKHRLLTAGNPTHDPGWSSWLQVFPHSQRGGRVSTRD